MKLRTGDNVMILRGKDRGKTGKIVKVVPADERVVVEGLNMMKRHVRARKQGQKGQIVSRERAIHASSVALVCPSCKQPTRIGHAVTQGKDGSRHKARVCRKCSVAL